MPENGVTHLEGSTRARQDDAMDAKRAVKMCGECPTCRYTRAQEKITLRYRISRFIQRRACPFCRAANRELDRDFQKSPKLDA